MLPTRYKIARFLNVIWILVLAAVLIAAYTYQFTTKQDPCPLCELQRLAMIATSIGAMLNLRYGLKRMHYSIGIFGCLFGTAVSLRQISLHICPKFPTFGTRILGYELYTWSFVVFYCSLLGVAILLLLFRPEDAKLHPKMNWFEISASMLMFLLAVANAVTTFMACGFGYCQG